MPGWNNAAMASEADRVRLDKWLWAARFYKTRALATEAVQGGRVHLNGQRAKPSKDVRLYEETPESAEARETDRLMRKMAPPPPGADLGARPTKRDRRRLDQARRKGF